MKELLWHRTLKEYPKLQREDVLAALDYARRVLATDEIIPRIQSA